MLFPTLEFFVFFIFVFLMYWYLIPYFFGKDTKSLTLTHFFFTRSQLLFLYMSWDWRFGGLILLSTVIDFILADKIHSSQNQRIRWILITTSLVLNLVFILGFFKYYNFFCRLNQFISWEFRCKKCASGFAHHSSRGNFFLYVSVFELYDRRLSRTDSSRKKFFKICFVCFFFPQLVAGPIVTAKTFLPQLDTIKNLTEIRFRKAIRYFILGYIKKSSTFG
ncbi:putative alginate O-acetyltransferase AlgI [Leptospira interrogans serovar Canicola]|nr:putative alginate O-acetyltransferase AlgI [Leptospira interrogans serovar Canicola]